MNDRQQELAAIGAAVNEVFETIEIDDEMEAETKEPQRTLLEVWSHVMDNIEASEARGVPLELAAKVLSTYPMLKPQDLGKYQQSYHDRLRQMRDALRAEIATDPECFKHTATDAVDNRHHYLNLLVAWNVVAGTWERNWNYADRNSHIQFAAILDAHSFVLGGEGLIAHLSAIGFEFTEEDGESVREAALSVWEG